jgi:hypothetical protein
MPFNINCCGFNRDLTKITFLGIFTLVVPLLVLSWACWVVIYPASKFVTTVQKMKSDLELLINAEVRLINSALSLRQRCAISGKVFSYSPALAGFIYKYFNIFLLLLLWLIISTCICKIIWIIKTWR